MSRRGGPLVAAVVPAGVGRADASPAVLPRVAAAGAGQRDPGRTRPRQARRISAGAAESSRRGGRERGAAGRRSRGWIARRLAGPAGPGRGPRVHPRPLVGDHRRVARAPAARKRQDHLFRPSVRGGERVHLAGGCRRRRSAARPACSRADRTACVTSCPQPGQLPPRRSSRLGATGPRARGPGAGPAPATARQPSTHRLVSESQLVACGVQDAAASRSATVGNRKRTASSGQREPARTGHPEHAARPPWPMMLKVVPMPKLTSIRSRSQGQGSWHRCGSRRRSRTAG